MSKLKVDKDKLLLKIKSLTASSKCIQRTSKYLYQFYKSSDAIVQIWLQALNSCTDEERIPLFYIANEMLQSKSYGNSYFKKSWKPYLMDSIDCIKDSSINDKIGRILNIWIERKVYEKPFVESLISKLSVEKRSVKNEQQCKEIIMNFHPEECITKLKELIYVESQTVEPIRLHESSINFDEKSYKESIKKLKDKVNSNQFSAQLDQNINHLFQLCTMLEEELKVRQKTFELLNNAEVYYETQQKETLVVEDAYRRYGNQISKTKVALEEHLDFLMDDNGPMDIDDAPSPGKTPPHVYEDKKKVTFQRPESPMSVDEEGSPSSSINISEDDNSGSVDVGNYLDKPQSPAIKALNSKPGPVKPTATLSSTEAFKLLTSVFTQSLTKKPLSDINANVKLQPDIFHNTLATSTAKESPDFKSNEKSEKSDEKFADTFRLISNLTGLKNVRERTLSASDPPTNVGSTIPILTTKIPFKSNEECNDSKPHSFGFNQSNFSAPNVTSTADNIPRLHNPDIHQIPPFPPRMFNPSPIVNNQMFPLFGNTSRPPPPLPALFNTLQTNPLSFTMPPISQTNQRQARSPGSCTEDEDDGSATPTQDETARLNSTMPSTMFNKNVMQSLPANFDEINKHFHQALNSGSIPFNLSSMLSAAKEACTTHLPPPPLRPPPPQGQPWGPFNTSSAFTANMSMPFSLMNTSAPIQPLFTPTCNSKPNFGPPRAIRTKRPDGNETGASSTGEGHGDSPDSGSLSPVVHDRSPWAQSDSGSGEGDGPSSESRGGKPRSRDRGKW